MTAINERSTSSEPSAPVEPNVCNIGLWYYRSFFSEYHKPTTPYQADVKEFGGWLKKQYDPILKANFDGYSDAVKAISGITSYLGLNNFPLKTIYPGLVCGIGYEHELGFTNEFKLGFSFDHTTGLPYIPGSSVKGTLRSAFKHGGYLKSIIEGWVVAMSYPDKTPKCPEDLINREDDLNSIINNTDWEKLERHIFESIDYSTQKKMDSTYQTDVFFDAFISDTSLENKGTFMADDYITCHQNRKNPAMTPFTNPNPVRFLKVRSDVTFTFQFRLFDVKVDGEVIFPKSVKEQLFKQILLDIGIGAKTNVGYGQFE